MKKVFLIPLMLLAGCASIIDGSKQEVSISTEPPAPAKCGISGEDYNADIETPAKIEVRRSYYPLHITCTDSAGKTGDVKVLSDVSGWGYGGAVLGLGVGAVVDTSTGDAFEYPKNIVVTIGQSKTLGVTGMNSNKDFK